MLGLLGEAFILGVLTPITAGCILPLFPGFLAFLANQTKLDTKYATALFGGIVASGSSVRVAIGIGAIILGVIVLFVAATQREIRTLDGRDLAEDG